MIITRLAGGLGNQMFHYAIARRHLRSSSEKIILDTRLLKELETDIEKIVQRPYYLHIFKELKAEPLNDKLNTILTGKDIFNRIKKLFFILNTAYVVQNGMTPIKVDVTNKRNIFFIGDFQSELYFKDIRKELMCDFCFPDLDSKNQYIKKKILNTPNALSIHVRRGDYHSLSNKNIFTSVNLNYYNNSIKYLQQQLGLRKLEAYLFTDDIEWAKTNFKSDSLNINFMGENNSENGWKDMCLMASCQHHIIANSSFSWWGAWLSQRGGINLAPQHWYLPNSNFFSIKDIVPESWVIIDYPL